mgnify:CR=1 FL=1
MLINNYDIKSKYGAILSEKKISPCKTNIGIEWLKNSLSPFIIDKQTKFCSIKCKFTFTADTEQEFEKRFSEFNKNIIECNIRFDNINMNYHCYIDNVDDPERITPYYWETSAEWIGYKYGDEVTEILNHVESKTIIVDGNLPTPAIVTITVPIDTIDMRLIGFGGDIVVRNLKANTPIIINGEEGTITENWRNKFADTDMWEFPKLAPGKNTITTSKANSNINIKYKPRWI